MQDLRRQGLLAEQVRSRLQLLPLPLQRQVLDFIEFLRWQSSQQSDVGLSETHMGSTATSLEMRVQWLNRLDTHRQTVGVSKGLADSAVLQLRQEERY